MANPSQDSPLQTLYRLTVMLGVLACGSMAAYRYGPEADQLAGMIDTVAERLGVEVAAEPAAAEPRSLQIVDARPIEIAEAGGLAPSGEAPRFDWDVRPAAATEPVRPQTAQVDPIDRERLVAPVLAAGATRAEIARWSDGQYRATAAMPVGDPAAGLYRQFDVQGLTPEQAATELLRQVQTEASR